MSEGANDALLVKAWKARNTLYEELFGAHLYSLPKHYTPPAGSLPGVRRATEAEEKSSRTAGTGAAVNFAIGDDKSVFVQNSEGGEPSDMQPIRDLVSSFFVSDLSSQRITVLAYKPTDTRPYWLYVTAGLSNPWYQDEAGEVSGFGCELMVKSETDALWPIRLLRRMAYYIMSYSGTLSPGVILNLKDPIVVSREARADLNNLFIWYADEAPDCWYQLPSGGFGLFCAVGITEDECRFADSITDYGAWSIQQVLRQTGVGQLTEPRRASIMSHKDIGGILSSVRTYAENFRPAAL